MRTLLIIGAGATQIAALRVAQAKGLRAVVVDNKPRAPAMALADKTFAVDLRDVEGVCRIAKQEHADGVLCVSAGAAVRLSAAICHALGLRGLSPQAAAHATHKGTMREALAKHGALVPRYRRTFDLDEARAAALDLGLPLVLQPATGCDLQAPCHVYVAEQLDSAYARAIRSAQGTSEIIVEECCDGPEASVETLSYDGQHHIIAITDRLANHELPWLPVAHVEPSRLPRVAQTQIRVATLAALDALDIMDSAAHVRLRLSRKGPRIIDVGPCLAGDHITTELVPRSTGIDMVAAAVDVALSDTPQYKATRYGAAAVRYLRIKPGTVTTVAGVEEARSQHGIAALEVLVGVGDALLTAHETHGLSGYIIAEGADPSEAEQRAECAASCVHIETSVIDNQTKSLD